MCVGLCSKIKGWKFDSMLLFICLLLKLKVSVFVFERVGIDVVGVVMFNIIDILFERKVVVEFLVLNVVNVIVVISVYVVDIVIEGLCEMVNELLLIIVVGDVIVWKL